jgi:hypothetical protein
VLVRVENGFGQCVGSIEVGNVEETTEVVTIEWTTKVKYTKNTHGEYLHRITLPLRWVVPWGPVIATHWKERARLVRAGILQPYSETHFWGGHGR